MTDDQLLVTAALEKFGGDRQLAAIAIGKTVRAVEMIIYKVPELRVKYAGSTAAPMQSAALHRANGDEAPIRLQTDDRNLVISMAKEDRLLAEGLERLGLKPEEVQRAIGLRDFSKHQFVESVQIVGASMTKICVQLGTQMTSVMQRLDDVRSKLGNEDTSQRSRTSLVEEEKYLSQSLVDMAEQVRRMSDTAHRGMMLQAMIRYKLLGLQNGTRKEAPLKPGFGTDLPMELVNERKNDAG